MRFMRTQTKRPISLFIFWVPAKNHNKGRSRDAYFGFSRSDGFDSTLMFSICSNRERLPKDPRAGTCRPKAWKRWMAPSAGRHLTRARQARRNPMPAEYWDAVLKDAGADTGRFPYPVAEAFADRSAR